VHEVSTLLLLAVIGVAVYAGEEEIKRFLLKRADDHLYEAQRDGRNRVQFISPLVFLVL